MVNKLLMAEPRGHSALYGPCNDRVRRVWHSPYSFQPKDAPFDNRPQETQGWQKEPRHRARVTGRTSNVDARAPISRHFSLQRTAERGCPHRRRVLDGKRTLCRRSSAGLRTATARPQHPSGLIFAVRGNVRNYALGKCRFLDFACKSTTRPFISTIHVSVLFARLGSVHRGSSGLTPSASSIARALLWIVLSLTSNVAHRSAVVMCG